MATLPQITLDFNRQIKLSNEDIIKDNKAIMRKQESGVPGY